ncbi:S9 family peptidase [Psychrobium sp. 1_MG-2023]|uniref:alpha/beta hydrolase family protein n=1 Tax=Psychrobium sp. 1_MG-2023 TaxID=3062624 RepID=UPI000C32C2FA|nr:alpha/beta fold hydrolase [Psychrobium sp. 1_MG-2023]MDP2562806.1 alpha/beta fold hydrolase [Psychrobium sp. 1_MG-2023]PKF54445.1 hypothetical protein CW748_15865 [Alteromonadales bacterium alter-6D02]
MIRVLLAITLFVLSSYSVASIDKFVKHHKYRNVKISPSGDYLAISRFQNNESDLVIVDTKTMKAVEQLYFKGREEVGTFYWANNNRLVMKIFAKHPAKESPVYYGELFAIDMNNRNGKLIFGNRITASKATNAKERKIRETHKAMASSWAEVVNLLPNDDQHILITAEPYNESRTKQARLYKLNIYTAAITPVTKEPLPNSWITTDANGELLLAVGRNKHNKRTVFTYEKDSNRWLESTSFDYGNAFLPLSYDAKTNALLALDNLNQETESLVNIDIKTGQRTLMFNDPNNDIHRVELTDDRTHLFGFSVMAEYPTYYFPDSTKQQQSIFKALTENFPGQHVTITSNTPDFKKIVFKVSSDRNPGTWYLFDTQTNKASFVASANNQIDPAIMLSTLSFDFKSRDNHKIPGYITLPNVSSKQNLPSVILVHGGPYGVRDTWDYNHQVQLLASQGYAVVQINYRGSGGFGRTHKTSAYQRWGDMIQYDIIDGVDYLKKHNLIDGDRVCIMGASFGGYAAVQASILAPEKFQCAIAASGVYNLHALFEDGNIQGYIWGQSFLKQTLGVSKEKLKQFSPFHNIEKLNTPLLISHGEIDEQAPYAQAKAFRNKLKQKNKKHYWLLFDNEGHGIYNEKNRKKYYLEVLDFLEKYNPVG